MVIFLVGFMGAGKTAIAQLVAKEYNYTYIDTDAVIEARMQNTISYIFEEEGEEAFRSLEARILRTLLLEQNTIIATGGGLPCYHNNMEWMNKNGTTLYIEHTPYELEKRLLPLINTRPLLKNITTLSLSEHISKLLHQRIPFYKQAKYTLNESFISAQTVINTINKECE